jgi:hypothetical protein
VIIGKGIENGDDGILEAIKPGLSQDQFYPDLADIRTVQHYRRFNNMHQPITDDFHLRLKLCTDSFNCALQLLNTFRAAPNGPRN